MVGSGHFGHNCKKYRATGTLKDSRVRCGECHQMMGGLFFNGVECNTCDEIYHYGCFKNEEESESDEAQIPDDPGYSLLVKPHNLELDDFYLKGVDLEGAHEVVRTRRPGVFLMIDVGTEKALVIKEHDRDALRVVDIKTAHVHGEKLFYVEKGTSGNTILGLTKQIRKRYKLYCPGKVPHKNYDFEEAPVETDDSDSSDSDSSVSSPATLRS